MKQVQTHAAHSDVHAFRRAERQAPHGNRFGHCRKYAGAHIWRAHVWLTHRREHSYADAHRRPDLPSGHGPPDERSWQLGSVWPGLP